jgi:adenine phosphoribosyltransferase
MSTEGGGAGEGGVGAIDLRGLVREVDDFPTPGVGFKDITPLLADPQALPQTISDLAAWVRAKGADLVVGAEARGFILGAAIAAQAGCGFVPARRPGKLPPETLAATYVLEYGENVLEMHPDLIPIGARVVIHDDVLATGGTVDAICGLIERIGGEVVGACFIIELGFLGARDRLAGLDLYSLITY